MADQPEAGGRLESLVPADRKLRAVGVDIHASDEAGRRVVWALGFGAFGLAWSITTISAYVPALLGQYTSSSSIIGLVLASEAIFALALPLLIGPMSDATQSSLGHRRPYMLLALLPMAVTLALVSFMHSVQGITLALFGFFFAYYLYEPPYRGLYPDLLSDDQYGRAQGIQHILRGVALGGALVGGGFLYGLWKPAPFVLGAVVVLLACGAVVALVRESVSEARRLTYRFREDLVLPLQILRRDKAVRRFMIANGAWEMTFAGMRTFVVLYFVDGLGEPVRTSSIVLAVVALGYVVAAVTSSLFGHKMLLGRVILAASFLYGVGLVLIVFNESWHWYYLSLIFAVAVAAGFVMTLAWGLLFKVMPPKDHGTVTGLAVMTKGIGLALGPLAVGGAIDVAHGFFESTDGYAIVWPVCGIPILLAIPFVVYLARLEESLARGTATQPAA